MSRAVRGRIGAAHEPGWRHGQRMSRAAAKFAVTEYRMTRDAHEPGQLAHEPGSCRAWACAGLAHVPGWRWRMSRAGHEPGWRRVGEWLFWPAQQGGGDRADHPAGHLRAATLLRNRY